MSKTYGSGSFEKHPTKEGYYYYTVPLGGSKRSKKILCKGNNLKAAQKLYEAYLIEQKAIAERIAADEARAALEALEAARETSTVRSYLEARWLEVKGKLAGTSRHLYESSLTVHIYRDGIFCRKDIHSLTEDDVKAFLARRGQAGATENTQCRLYKHLKWYFKKAKLPNMPFDFDKSERPKANKSRVVSFEPEDEQTLLKFAMNDQIFRPIIVWLLDTGARSGEALGLKWDAISFTRGECEIKRTLDMVDYQCALKDDAKSTSSLRTIPLSAFTLDLLKALKAAKKASSDDFVFPGGDGPGGCWNRYKFTRRWNALLIKAGLPPVGIHVTRHTVATRLIRSGMPLTAIAARLGHSSPEITLRVYAHAFQKDGVQLASAFDYFAKTVLAPNLHKDLHKTVAA